MTLSMTGRKGEWEIPKRIFETPGRKYSEYIVLTDKMKFFQILFSTVFSVLESVVRDVHLWLCFMLVFQRPARQVQGCEVPGGQRGRCVNMEDCVLRDIHLDYVKNKGYFCLLRNQRLVLTLSVIISVVNLQFQLYQIRIFEGWLSWWVTCNSMDVSCRTFSFVENFKVFLVWI